MFAPRNSSPILHPVYSTDEIAAYQVCMNAFFPIYLTMSASICVPLSAMNLLLPMACGFFFIFFLNENVKFSCCRCCCCKQRVYSNSFNSKIAFVCAILNYIAFPRLCSFYLMLKNLHNYKTFFVRS